MDNLIIGFIVLLGLLFLSRMISEKGLKVLDQNKKAELVDLFSGNRIYTLGVTILIVVVYIASARFDLVDQSTAFILYVTAILIFMVVRSYMAYKKLKGNKFPDAYIKSYLLSTSIVFAGLIFFFALMKWM